MAIPAYSQKRAVQDNLPTNVSSESEESSSDSINAARLETPANIIRMQTTFGNQKTLDLIKLDAEMTNPQRMPNQENMNNRVAEH